MLSGAIFHCMKKEKKFDQRKLQVTLEIFASSGFIVGSLNTGLLQKQRSRGALRKKCSENMQQIFKTFFSQEHLWRVVSAVNLIILYRHLISL